MKKRILFILPSLEVGGLQRVQVTLANALVKIGYDVTVMILEPIDELKSDLDERVHLVHKRYKRHLGGKIPYIRHKYYDDGMWETRAMPKQLHKYYVDDEHYNVEIAFFRGLSVKIVSGGCEKKHNDFRRKSLCTKKFNTDFSESVVHRQAKTKHIAWVHNDFRQATGYVNNFKSMKDVYKAYSAFDHVVCVSEEAQTGFKEVIGDTANLTTIYNMLPVDNIKSKSQEKPAVSIRKGKIHLVLVGRLLDSAKGQKRLIDVIARLHDEGEGISLALVGGGGDEQMLREEIAKKHAEDYITMCGNQMNPYPFIREADLLVCASYFEGYNLTVAEALIIGTPVLSTNCTGPNEILDYGKYGMIVQNSEDGLYQGIKEILNNPEMLKTMRKNAVERQSFFNEERLLKQMIDIFEED